MLVAEETLKAPVIKEFTVEQREANYAHSKAIASSFHASVIARGNGQWYNKLLQLMSVAQQEDSSLTQEELAQKHYSVTFTQDGRSYTLYARANKVADYFNKVEGVTRIFVQICEGTDLSKSNVFKDPYFHLRMYHMFTGFTESQEALSGKVYLSLVPDYVATGEALGSC